MKGDLNCVPGWYARDGFEIGGLEPLFQNQTSETFAVDDICTANIRKAMRIFQFSAHIDF